MLTSCTLSRQLSGDTPLILAAYWGEEAICRRLLESGARKAVEAINGETALDKARRQGHAPIVTLLESHTDVT